MNLIEQLGGYECAKAEYDDPMYEDGELYTIKATGARFFKHNLADELLQYRRQHNIFEVGDKVVWRKSLTPISSLMEITDLDGETWGIRHATDAEIKVGKRLEVNDGN